MNTGEIIAEEANRYLEKYDDTTTLCAEMLDGKMYSEFEFTPAGNELYGHDGRALSPIFDDALVTAERNARKDPNMQFEVDRNKTEKDELRCIKAMVRGELPNTMVVVSDYPESLKNATKDVGGYNVTRKQTFLRIITMRDDGKIHISSQSLDQSDRDGLEAIYDYFGQKPEPGELLGQRIHKDLPAEEQEFLSDWLLGTYDRTMAQKYGGQWHAGRRPADYRNTLDFVKDQHDLIDSFVMRSLEIGSNESMLYNLAAALRERFKANGKKDFVPLSAIRSHGDVFMEMQFAGEKARSEGWVASGCGLTLGEDGQPLGSRDGFTESWQEELGYGLGTLESDQYGSRTFKCQNGHTNTRPKDKLIEKCTTCHCDVGCGAGDVVKEAEDTSPPKLDAVEMLLKSVRESTNHDEPEFTLAA